MIAAIAQGEFRPSAFETGRHRLRIAWAPRAEVADKAVTTRLAISLLKGSSLPEVRCLIACLQIGAANWGARGSSAAHLEFLSARPFRAVSRLIPPVARGKARIANQMFNLRLRQAL